ncbi:MAG: hypothetical protein ACTHLR_02290 [Rhizomicrobium sp.]
MLMERLAEIVRGWPYDGALDRSEPIKSGSTLQNGDWVIKQADGTVDKVGANLPANIALAGLVVVGNGDSSSASNAGEAVVLWKNFIAKIANYDATAGAYAPTQPLTVKNGILTKGTPGTDPIVAYVLDVVAVATGLNPQTAHITIVTV